MAQDSHPRRSCHYTPILKHILKFPLFLQFFSHVPSLLSYIVPTYVIVPVLYSYYCETPLRIYLLETSLAAQWLRIHLPVVKNLPAGLPWWHSGWESACQCRGHRFEPWSGKIPHAAEKLGLWATTTEPARLELQLRSKSGHDSERPTHRDEEWPPLAATRESSRTETKTQHSQK